MDRHSRDADRSVRGDVFERAAAELSERELAELSRVIAVINSWNRLGGAARPPG